MTQSFWETAVGPGALREVGSSRVYGVVEAIVSDNVDPERLGRVKVRFPWWTGREGEETSWARIARGFAGKGHGTWFLPEVDDEVLVMFEHGDTRFPFVVGCLWNRKDQPPTVSDVDGLDTTRKAEQVASAEDDHNQNSGDHVRFIRSRSGHILRLHDEAGVAFMDKTGVHRVDILPDTAEVQVTNADGDVEIRAPVGTVRLKGVNVKTHTTERTKITSLDQLDLIGKQTTTVHAAAGLELAGMDVSDAVAGKGLDFASGLSTVAVSMKHFTALAPTGNVTVKSTAPVRLLGAKVHVNPPNKVGEKAEKANAQAVTAGATLGALLEVMRTEGNEEQKQALAKALAEVLGGEAPADQNADQGQADGGLPQEVVAPPAEPLDAPPEKAQEVPGKPKPTTFPEKDDEGKIMFRMMFRVDTDSEAGNDDTVELKSKDGAYTQRLSPVKDGKPVGTGMVEVVFTGMHADDYTLTYDPGAEGEPYALFENRPIG